LNPLASEKLLPARMGSSALRAKLRGAASWKRGAPSTLVHLALLPCREHHESPLLPFTSSHSAPCADHFRSSSSPLVRAGHSSAVNDRTGARGSGVSGISTSDSSARVAASQSLSALG